MDATNKIHNKSCERGNIDGHISKKEVALDHNGRFWEQDQSYSPDKWITRNPDLLYLTGPHPLNAEPPAEKLMESGFFTSNDLHYVRNHGTVPKLDWDTHTVTVEGLIPEGKKIYTMYDLVNNMPSQEVSVTITCDGNRRKEVNAIKRSNGFNWGPCATGTAKWTGVPLWELLADVGITFSYLQKLASEEDKSKIPRFVCFEGADTLANGEYGTSVPIEWAVDPQRDYMLAYLMNNDQIPADHGFPVRMVLPGLVGGRMVKWLSRIIISDKESTNWYHWHDNKMLPSSITQVNAAKYWMLRDHTLYEMNINSVITSPGHGDIIDVSNPVAMQTVAGFAYSGGGRKIIRVELTLDHGKSWKEAKFEYPENVARHGTKHWTWCHWKIEFEVWRFIQSEEIAVRAVDDSCNTQPEQITWNCLGMMNNSWYKLKLITNEFEKTEPGHEPEYARPWVEAQHPVCPGNMPGGWMMPSTLIADNINTLKGQPTDVEAISFFGTVTGKEMTEDEVAKHNTLDDCWIIMDGAVYDVTPYMRDHPGGLDPIGVYAGRDASKAFHDIHPTEAYETLSWYRIGALVRPTNIALGADARRKHKALLTASHWVNAKLTKKENVAKDVLRMTFDLSSSNGQGSRAKVGLPVGQHILFQARVDDATISRPYTPIEPVGDTVDDGRLTFLIKVYPGNEEKNIPGGMMTTYLNGLNEGSSLHMKGPAGPIMYFDNNCFMAHGNYFYADYVNLVAGGTGITPMYQIITAMLSKESKKITAKLALLYANRNESDILLKAEFDALADKYPDSFKLFYVISNTPEDADWRYGEGHVNIRMAKRFLYPSSDRSVTFVCGPPAMVQQAIFPCLSDIGFDKSNVYEF